MSEIVKDPYSVNDAAFEDNGAKTMAAIMRLGDPESLPHWLTPDGLDDLKLITFYDIHEKFSEKYEHLTDKPSIRAANEFQIKLSNQVQKEIIEKRVAGALNLAPERWTEDELDV